jgi:glycosyltransferase involved in cell wall biosynthesis
MRITFALPGTVLEPAGGAKIVYQYAARLADKGHMVTVLHPRTWDPVPGPAAAIKSLLWPSYIRKNFGGHAPWIPSHPGVTQRMCRDLTASSVPDAEVIVATFFRTAPPVNLLPASKGKKFYFIQHYEDWADPAEEVDATWRLPMEKIVISRWLMETAERLGVAAQTHHVPNAMDLDKFQLRVPPAQRPPSIAMLVNTTPFKGLADGLEALTAAKEAVPELKAVGFGTEARPDCLPAWIEYICKPGPGALEALYNSAQIFLQPSHAEGWGLTSTEAMACGCALVTTDNGGSRDYALHNQTALVCPVRQPQALTDAALQLLRDPDTRLRLAMAGHEHVQQYNWQRSAGLFEEILLGQTPHQN